MINLHTSKQCNRCRTNFKDWITQFRDEDTPRGDLSYDISRDKFFPESNDKVS
jgi:hypothetical protein